MYRAGRGWRGSRGGRWARNGYPHGQHSRSLSPPRGRPALRSGEEWFRWTELTVRIRGLPATAQTINVFDILSPEGNVTKIDLLEYPDGTRTGDAFVTFSPPPSRAFWDLDDWKLESEDNSAAVFPLTIMLQDKKRMFGHRSPVDPSVIYPERPVLHPVAIEIGFMYREDQMMIMQGIKSSGPGSVTMLLNLLRREIVFEFSVVIPDARRRFGNTQTDRIKFQIPFHQLDSIWELEASPSESTLVITLDRPPAFYRKLHDIEQSFDDGRHWHERFSWARMTDIRQRGPDNDTTPLRLKKSDHVIDIGRWTTYKITFNKEKLNRGLYDLVKRALTDYNVKYIHPGNFETVPRSNATVWDWIDLPESSRSTREFFLEAMSSDVRHLAWPVRYQLESCISQGCLNERNITKEFIQRLESMPEREALLRLEAAADKRKRIFEPLDILVCAIPRPAAKKIPSHCILQRSATVTPSTIYYATPAVEMSNRVLRQYKEHADRFLRVRFTDEKFEGRIHATDDDTQDAVFTRVYHCLTRGIQIGDRHFEFLAMGNSQFREHGAYFFASTPTLKVADMREQLGQIGRIRNNRFVPERVVAKFASRLGQCFSTTHPIRGIQMKIIEIADVLRNGYDFTDGVGKVSSFVAQMIASELNLRESWSGPPSAFQFRMGGIKGIVAVSPELKGNEIHIRSSQYKFAAIYEGLEIIRWSSYTVPRLNRQLITVLQSLHIPDEIFLAKMKNELLRLENAMEHETVALSMLQEQIDFNQMTLTLSNIMFDGFMSAKDPFAVSILRLWRAWSTKQLKEKAALSIHDGAFLLGCTDETATLRGYFENAMPRTSSSTTIQDRLRALPEIFVQVPDFSKKGTYRVIEEVCIVARNPSLHPGDIRVVRGVDVPALHHLKDAVVFPQTGDRDIPSMCSGGDLDGDDFLVIWDKELIPPPEDWDVKPMDFTPLTPREVDKVTVHDLVSFFVTYMKSDTLRTIATSHLANADQLPGGVWHPNCLKLANEHSIAVDYPKSGIPPNPIHKLRPFKYPHFMKNRHRPKERVYHSNTILGRLYDEVPEVDFRPMLEFPFDMRILDAFELEASLMEAASEIKVEYDAAMRRIMAQHDIKTEFEVWTTFVMDHAQLTNDYKFHEEIGRISVNLKEQFTDLCYQRAGGKDFETIAPFVTAMYKVTAMEVASALKAQEETRMDTTWDGGMNDKRDDLPLISFPWLFHHELGKIARGAHGAARESAVAQQAATKRHLRKTANLIDIDDDEDKIETEEGFTHRGDLLELALHANDGETLADRQHAAMVDENKESNAGAEIDNDSAKNTVWASGSGDSDGGVAIEEDLEEGELIDNAHKSDAMDGLEVWSEMRNGVAHVPSSYYHGLEALAQTTMPNFDDQKQPLNMADETIGGAVECAWDLDMLPEVKQTSQTKSPPIAESNGHTADTDMTDECSYETEEVMIDIDDEPSPFDKLDRILRS